MKKLIYGLWYIITYQKKFRLKYPDGTYSKLMTYDFAYSYIDEIENVKVCVEIKPIKA